MLILARVDDVGRRPGDAPEAGTDGRLEYFERWRASWGQWPAVYGVVPAWIHADKADWLTANLAPGEALAVHGIDHKRGALPAVDQFVAARKWLGGSTALVPPFNDCPAQMLDNWRMAGGEVVLGGFDREHHQLGPAPCMARGLFHVPAHPRLYGRATELMQRVTAREVDEPYPVCLTLHVPWDEHLSAVQALGATLLPHLASLDDVRRWWTVNSDLDINQLTAPHYYAYRAVLDWLQDLEPGSQVLDFGSRYSHLPRLLMLRGLRVTAFDRDPKLPEYQRKLAGSAVKCEVGDIHEYSAQHAGTVQAITACWAVQHNDHDRQAAIMRSLANLLAPGGRLAMVNRHCASGSHYDGKRSDPIWGLDWLEAQNVLVQPSGLKLVDRKFFHYEHATAVGDWCEPDKANAVCMLLRKDG